ncbi:unnamed protein product [Agarophyton chilense]
MDGTILNSNSGISIDNITAVNRLLEETGVLFVPATGKSRVGALRSMKKLGERLRQIYPYGCPGVYLQGLLVFNTKGEVVYENKCDAKLTQAVTSIAKELEMPLIAYSRDRILCEEKHEIMDLLPSYHEPAATQVEDWEKAFDATPLNKFIFMAEPKLIDQLRPLVAEKVGEMGNLTQAQSNMLEVLPPNSSKGDGVRRLLDDLDVHPDNVLAIGDAENDLELLKMVGYSCAVGNALPSVKEVAMFKDLPTNDEHAVAHAIGRFFFNEYVEVK